MSSVKPGDVVANKYRVERVLGSGGMGYVVAARHLQLDQLVAIKFLRRNGASLDETEATGRFLREAKAVVRLKDEHVAKVFDVGTHEGGEPYIVMEHLDGCDLSALAKQRGQIPASEAVEYIMQACEALAEAHSLGIVHRDVKLANLFLTRGHAGSPLVKVLDFGISKVNPFGEAEHEMTRTASMLGSPRFMSPEQVRDPRSVDARSDIWSLGVVLYRLVGGKPPFEAETLGGLLAMVMHDNPSPLSVARADLPLGFSETVGRCLEKDPGLRYSNIAELAYALVPFAVDAHRARGVADRIAATLSVAQMPRTLEFHLPNMTGPMPSNPPGYGDTGTAAPWTGTQGGGKRDRGGMIWAAMALVATLGAGGLFAKLRHDRALETAAVNAQHRLNEAAITAGAPGPESEIAPMTPPPAPPIPDPPATAASTFNRAGVGISPPRTPATGPELPVRPRPPPPVFTRPRKPARPSVAPATTPSPAPVKNGEGIPPTRD